MVERARKFVEERDENNPACGVDKNAATDVEHRKSASAAVAPQEIFLEADILACFELRDCGLRAVRVRRRLTNHWISFLISNKCHR